MCFANICRSPLAEGIAGELAARQALEKSLSFDSAGTSSYHAGKTPDLRSIAIAQQHGIDISQQISRQVIPADFENFSYILAMDLNNYENLLYHAPIAQHHKIHLLLEYWPAGNEREVPDPYFLPNGFAVIYDMLSKAIGQFLEQLPKV